MAEGAATARPAAAPAAAPALNGAAASMLSAMAGFALADLCAKRLGAAGVPALELVALRLACLALWLGWLLARGARLRRPRHPWLQGLRGLCIVGSALLFVAGLARLPLAMATALVFSSPIFVTLLSVLLLRERVPPARWLWWAWALPACWWWPGRCRPASMPRCCCRWARRCCGRWR
jgi:drug/metabolite transporter (DMT)-like permease